MSRVPIRLRLTGAFALAMTLVLVGAGLFTYARLRIDLDDSVDAGLATRVTGVAALRERSDATLRQTGAGALGDAEESLAQLYDASGRLTDTTGGARRAVLTAADVRQVLRDGELFVEREVPGIEGVARVLARALEDPGGTDAVVAAGRSLEDRDETLHGLIASFAIGGPIAVLLAAAIGFWLAGLGLRPVEAMRRRAEQVSLASADERLPLPIADDEIRRLGETLNEMLARLQSSFQRERRFVADASHELRTPLAVQKTELEAALRRGGHDPEVHESLVAALAEADHMAQLADDLLLLARSDDAGIELRPETVDVRELLEGCARRFGDRADELGLEIDVEAPVGLTAHLDPLRMRQALGNLTDNALRHGAGDVVLAAREAGGVLQIEVRDEGAGFSPQFAPQAFERFARAAPGRTRGGSGLGLSIVRTIARAHGGEAEIVTGEPTTVRLAIPAR